MTMEKHKNPNSHKESNKDKAKKLSNSPEGATGVLRSEMWDNYISERRRELTLIIISTIMIVTGLIFSKRLRETPLFAGEYAVFLTAYAISGWKVLRNAGYGIIRGKLFDENFLMASATIGAIIIHQLPEAATVMLFFHIGEYLQSVSLRRSRQSIKKLLEIRPEMAWVKRGKELLRKPPDSVQIGELIVVKPGERIPLDGVVVSGRSLVDASPLTGESLPRSIKPEATVLAGMINRTGALTIKVLKRFDDSSFARIIQITEKALEKKAKTEKFITRFARFYTPCVLAGAMALAVVPPMITGSSFKPWIYRALVLLVISCPCALLVSIPLGYIGGIGKASKLGILIKGSNYLDLLPSVRTVIFDKTGTLTRGVFEVQRIISFNGFTENEVLHWAALAESLSHHPIAESIRNAYNTMITHQSSEKNFSDKGLNGVENESEKSKLSEYEEIGGYGIRAIFGERRVVVGNDRILHLEKIPHKICTLPETSVHVAVDGKLAGTIIIGDELREDTKTTISRLRNLGVKRIGMLTGDNRYTASRLSTELGLDFYQAELLPDEKVIKIEEIIMEREGKNPVAFIGDGINDAPVIARADIGIAMGKEGSDAAIETADIVLLSESSSRIVNAIEIGKKTRRVIWQNIVSAITIKGIFIILGSLGFATMWEAVFADMGVTILAILNTMRILRGHFTR